MARLAVLLVLAVSSWSVLAGEYASSGEIEEELVSVGKRSIPTNVYPELLVVVDTNLKKKLNVADGEIIKYMQRFFGSVQKVYDSVEQPKFHFSLADVYICETDEDCSFIRKRQTGDTLHVPDTFMNEMAQWAKGKRADMAKYDLLITMTSLTMCKKVNADGSCPRGVGLAGKAYLAGACSDSVAVGIATDDGGFSGIKVTSHEMAHTFGARHDGESGGGEACSPRDGYIMGGGYSPENHFRLSPCSQISMADFASSSKGKCIREKSAGKYDLDYTMIGASKSLDEQCRDKYGPDSKNCPFKGINADICKSHFCYYPETGTCRSGGSAFTGTSCDDTDNDKVCYMSYGCVNKDFQIPVVKVDWSKVAAKTTMAPPAGGCIDSKGHSLSVVVNGKSTGCAEQFQLYPDKFCETSWAHRICCATAKLNCEANGDVKVRGGTTTPSDEETTPRSTPRRRVTTPVTQRPTFKLETTPKAECRDELLHHLKVVVDENEKTTDCPTQFQKHPVEFCGQSWVSSICCGTVADSCLNGKPKSDRLSSTPVPGCQDRKNMHLRITMDGKMQDCASNYKDHPAAFCRTSWVKKYCCGTHTTNC